MIMYLPKEQKWERRKYHVRGFFVAGVEFLCSSKLTYWCSAHAKNLGQYPLYHQRIVDSWYYPSNFYVYIYMYISLPAV